LVRRKSGALFLQKCTQSVGVSSINDSRFDFYAMATNKDISFSRDF
jgi:hypothetical protein